MRIVLSLCSLSPNIGYAYRPIHLVKAEQKGDGYVNDQNGLAQVPTLTFKETKNDENRTMMNGDPNSVTVHTLTQSLAIIQFLAATYKLEIFPTDPVKLGQVQQFSEVINSGIQPLQNFSTMKAVTASIHGTGRDFGRHFMKKGLEYLESLAASYPPSKYIHGDTVTLSEVCLVPQLYNARRFGFDVEKEFPTLFRVEQECLKLVYFREAAPENMPDAQLPVQAAAPPSPAVKEGGEGGEGEKGAKRQKI